MSIELPRVKEIILELEEEALMKEDKNLPGAAQEMRMGAAAFEVVSGIATGLHRIARALEARREPMQSERRKGVDRRLSERREKNVVGYFPERRDGADRRQQERRT